MCFFVCLQLPSYLLEYLTHEQRLGNSFQIDLGSHQKKEGKWSLPSWGSQVKELN